MHSSLLSSMCTSQQMLHSGGVTANQCNEFVLGFYGCADAGVRVSETMYSTGEQPSTNSQSCANSVAGGSSCNSVVMQLACKRTCGMCPSQPIIPTFTNSLGTNTPTRGVCSYAEATHTMTYWTGSSENLAICDRPGQQCFCHLTEPSPPPSPDAPPAPPGGVYRVYNFTVVENYATVSTRFDSDAKKDRFNQYSAALANEISNLAQTTTASVAVTIGRVVHQLNGTVPVVGDRRRRAQTATCERQYTPVVVQVTLSAPQTAKWVQTVVDQAGLAVANSLDERVFQCDEMEATVDAPLVLVASSPPPPPDFPKTPPPLRMLEEPAAEPTNWNWLNGVVVLLTVYASVCCCFLQCSNDDGKNYERPSTSKQLQQIMSRLMHTRSKTSPILHVKLNN